jgi:hypothetical protein
MQDATDIFAIHKQIMDDYRQFVSSFIHIKDDRIRQKVEEEINQGKFWPEPLIQFNPSYDPGESIQSLCDRGILHQDMANIFTGFELYKHQVEAMKKGIDGSDFVVMSGTGSGKSLTFLGTIFDDLLKNKTGPGIEAVIIYPNESAEGSLGVLSQFIENKDVFHQVVAEAIHLCRYEDETYTTERAFIQYLHENGLGCRMPPRNR